MTVRRRETRQLSTLPIIYANPEAQLLSLLQGNTEGEKYEVSSIDGHKHFSATHTAEDEANPWKTHLSTLFRFHCNKVNSISVKTRFHERHESFEGNPKDED